MDKNRLDKLVKTIREVWSLPEDDADYGRLAEMIERMSLDHLLALVAHICNDNAEEYQETNPDLADTWRKNARIVENASKEVE